MGTIVPRKRRDGSIGYTAQIRLQRAGAVVHTEAKTFDRRPAARAWIGRREAELAKPGALEQLKMPDPPLAEVIDRYIEDHGTAIGRTKAQVLRTIKADPLGARRCSTIGSAEIVAFASDLDVAPQTRGNYISHLASIFAIAKPAWAYPLDHQAMKDAQRVLKKLRLTRKSRHRDRRPTLAELDRILSHFVEVKRSRPHSVPMAQIVLFAIFSTRRLEEITTIDRKDLERAHGRVLVRRMKHPGDKDANDTWCDLDAVALRVIAAMPVGGSTGPIFPYNADTIGTSFTRAMKLLGIEDLHFHDLRHDGISRLFEMGWTIPRVAKVSGHRSWQSLQRYAHLNQVGDKYADWVWVTQLTSAKQK